MKTLLYNPIFINPQAYYVFPRLTRYLQPDNESTSEPANYIGTIEVKVIAYGDTTLKRTYTNTDSIDLSEFKNTWIRISLFTKVGSCALGEWKIGNMESDLPYIDPEVLASLKAVVIVGNKTNNDSDRAIVKNLVDASNPFVISNASFKLNSGFGKYEQDFTDWKKSFKVTSFDSESIKFTSDVSWVLLYHPSSIGEDIPSFKVRIKLYGEGTLYYNYINQEGTYTSVAVKSEIFETPICYNTKYIGEKGVNVGFTLSVRSGECSGTITQIPSFEGAFVTDGINDLITSTKTVQEMLGGSNEITVVSMMANLDSRQILCNSNYNNTNGYNVRNTLEPNGVISMLGYTDKNGTTNNLNLIMGDKDSIKLTDKVNFNSDYVFYPAQYYKSYYQVAWYWTIIANKVLTTDQINQVIAYFNLDRTLKPDILCDVKKQGITNENHAEFGDKLIDFSGNGRDIQLNNIAWKGDSGIGKYNFSNINIIANRFEGTVTTNKCHFTKKLTNTTNNFCDLVVISPNEPIKFKVSGLSDGRKLFVANKSGSGSNYNFDNGEHEVSLSFAEGVLQNNPFGVTGDIGDIDVTVEFIPSHAGALCLDGVNDFGKVTGMPIYKDYTIVVDYERISGREEALISKAYIVNQGAFVLMETSGTAKHSYSFGAYTAFNRDDFTRTLLYQSKYKCGDVNLTIGKGIDGDTLWLGTLRNNDYRFFNGAIYSLMSFPYSMSEFLIERQLKKYKLGSLYPNMVEFRPIIKHDDRITAIKYYHIKGSSWIDLKPGDYISVGSKISITTNLKSPYTIANVMSSSLTDIKVVPSAGGGNAYDILGYVTDKSPQKITMDIQVDSSFVQWNPIVESNVPYKSVKYYKLVDTSWKAINVGDYVLVGQRILTQITTVGIEDEVVAAVSEQLDIYGINKNSNGEYNILGITSSTTPQNINITIDEYIRYEDIVQPYPSLFTLIDYDTEEVYSWGSKLKIGTKFKGNVINLLPDMYEWQGDVLYNGEPIYWNTTPGVVAKEMVFRWNMPFKYLIDNNEPKVILSPRLLRIPNSSYKILGYIPDISGHGNHGKINNSAYAEGSGVNEDGSYQFDGVDDFVTIPTLSSGGKQVLMKVNWNTINSIIYDQRGSGGFAIYCSDYNNPSDSITVPAYKGRNAAGTTYIDGIRNEYIIASQLRNVTHNIVEILDTSYAAGKTNPIIGKSHMNSNYGSLALYDFMLFDEISTDNKIKELNEYVGIEGNTE